MVAAGVYLVARFFPMFAPEVLLVIAITGAITLFIAATIAITATDIKRVLAYSTISQFPSATGQTRGTAAACPSGRLSNSIGATRKGEKHELVS